MVMIGKIPVCQRWETPEIKCRDILDSGELGAIVHSAQLGEFAIGMIHRPSGLQRPSGAHDDQVVQLFFAMEGVRIRSKSV